MLKKNQILTLQITEMTNLGYGVAHADDGQIVFVSGAVPKDTVSARVIRVTKGYAVARTEDVLERSPYRIDNTCTSRGCGGCAFRLVSYEHECAYKREYIQKCLKDVGLTTVSVAPVVSGKKTDGYRNKAQYPVGLCEDGSIYFGFYAPKSHRVVEASRCPLQPKAFADVLDTLQMFFNEKHVTVYDETSGKGLLRHVYLRESSRGDILLVLVINGRRLSCEEELVRVLREKHPEIVGVSVNIQTENTNVICGEEYRLLYGQSSLFDVLAGVSLQIAPDAFYQVNHEAAELLYAGARQMAALKKDEVLLDLYCGVGSIGLSMASDAAEVIGIEIVPEAVRCARDNAKANGIENASFYLGDAGTAASLLEMAEKERGAAIRPDVVVLDPPRKGCDHALLDYLATLAPKKIVYISCNPQTLARDMAVLTKNGYQASEVVPYNLFPRTRHVESVVCLTRTFDN